MLTSLWGRATAPSRVQIPEKPLLAGQRQPVAPLLPNINPRFPLPRQGGPALSASFEA